MASQLVNAKIVLPNTQVSNIYPKVAICFSQDNGDLFFEDDDSIQGFLVSYFEERDDYTLIEPLVEGWGTAYNLLFADIPGRANVVVRYNYSEGGVTTTVAPTTTNNVTTTTTTSAPVTGRWATYNGSTNTLQQSYSGGVTIATASIFTPVNNPPVSMFNGLAQLSDGRVIGETDKSLWVMFSNNTIGNDFYASYGITPPQNYQPFVGGID